MNLPSGYFISSSLAARDQDALEELFYFNPNQAKIRESVEAAVRQFGTPQMKTEAGRCRLVLPQIGEGQTMYLYKSGRIPVLAGVMIYVRDGNCLRILFWGLHPDHTCSARPQSYLLLEMIEALKQAGRKIVGIEKISFRFGAREHFLTLAETPSSK